MSFRIPRGNEIWSLDFMSDSLYQGRRFRALNILDEGVREALAIEIDTSLPAQRVVRVLQQLENWRGLPKAIRLDNGPELTSQHLAGWCKDKSIELRFIQPGKPNQNAFIERFNRSYRTEVLNSWLFTSLDEVREITHQWLQSYNEERPHEALGNLPPAVLRERLLAGKSSTFELQNLAGTMMGKKNNTPKMACYLFSWRRERDSNPRYG